LPPQSHRYKEASDLTPRPPLSGSNRIMPQPQPRYVSVICSQSFVNTNKPSAQPPHRSSKDNEFFPSRHPDADLSRLDRSRGSGHGHDPGYDKFSRDEYSKVDSPYQPRAPYEEPVRPQDMANRTSSQNDAKSRGPISPVSHLRPRESLNAVLVTPAVSASMVVEKAHGRSRDRSPRHHHESRQTNKQSSSASLPIPAMQSGPPQDMQLVEDHRHRGRRIERDREVSTLCVPVRNQLV
jgi:hypothetical protein